MGNEAFEPVGTQESTTLPMTLLPWQLHSTSKAPW
tara:strand:- start:205 stop:309 length:105 start_codon:yes stop_codon:yes gene_type:complete